jgi:ribonuclease R
MQQAVYSPDNVGHFGLAYEAYAHFTSPIRRYPDLLIHRAIKAVVNGEKYKAKDWNNLGVHCSMTERRADEATRDVNNWLKCYYMQDKIGEVYEGTIAGVTSFGVFVALDGVYVEGLVHVTELGNDYFNYDKARHEMVGERTGARFRLGDRLTVKVARVDLETAKIDFTLETANKAGAKTDALGANIHAPSRGMPTKTLNISPKKSAEEGFKPLSTRALDRAKKDRTGGKKLGKAASKSSIHASPKSRDRNTKNKGKR